MSMAGYAMGDVNITSGRPTGTLDNWIGIMTL